MHRKKSTKIECRMQKWQKPVHILAPYTWGGGDRNSNDNKILDLLHKTRTKYYKENKKKRSDDKGFSFFNMLQSAKEIIFDVVDDKPILYTIMYSFNVRRGEIEISHIWSSVINDESEEGISNDIRRTLAYAHALDVPVYPNTESVAPKLANYYKELMIDGFSINDKGKKSKYNLVKSPGKGIESFEYFEKLARQKNSWATFGSGREPSV